MWRSRAIRVIHIVLVGLFFSLMLYAGLVSAEDKHLGVATCDSSNCHGNAVRQTGDNVWLNEYRIWLSYDYHSRAYKTLQSPQSRMIAQKLGLSSATTADICLDCHADNMPGDLQGSKFQISDGVSCEACHGGAERWIDSHDNAGVTHADNIANGLYPLDDPTARAQMCLGCHMGTKDKFATHRIMGAGHPRLSFELETFTINQPPHFSMDEDYRQRKQKVDGATLWVTGQVESARRFLQLLQSDLNKTANGFPEFSLYDCQGCHHGLDQEDLRWYKQRKNAGYEPGMPRVADHHLQMMRAISDVLSPSATAELNAGIKNLATASSQGPAAVKAAAGELEQSIARLEAGWKQSSVSQAQVRQLRKALVARAASGREVDYGTAEQGLLGIVTLTTYLGESDAKAGAVDQLFDALGNDEDFSPKRYAAAAKRVAGRF
jgi:hypothetical protein